MATDAIKKFGLRSFRSGATGQALSNLTTSSGGVPQGHHYQALARALGHTSLTRVTMESYIGPLGSLMFDNSAILHREEEGSVGGGANFEARTARLTQYLAFAKPAVLSDMERAAKIAERQMTHLPKLSSDISLRVDADPAVVASKRVRVEVGDLLRRAEWKGRLVSYAGSEELVPPCLNKVVPGNEGTVGADPEDVMDVLFGKLQRASKTHTNARRSAVRRQMRKTATSGEAQAQGHLLLRLCPDLLARAVNIYEEYHAQRDARGNSCFLIFPRLLEEEVVVLVLCLATVV